MTIYTRTSYYQLISFRKVIINVIHKISHVVTLTKPARGILIEYFFVLNVNNRTDDGNDCVLPICVVRYH